MWEIIERVYILNRSGRKIIYPVLVFLMVNTDCKDGKVNEDKGRGYLPLLTLLQVEISSSVNWIFHFCGIFFNKRYFM